jgi:hypothetical protein
LREIQDFARAPHLSSASSGGAAGTVRAPLATKGGNHSEGVCSAPFGLQGDGDGGTACRDVGVDALIRIEWRKPQCRRSIGRHFPGGLESNGGRPMQFWR